MMCNYATYIVLALAVSSPIASVSESHLCEGETETETNLDFFGSTVKQNDLHLGGEIRYGNIGKVLGQDVDLVVTAVGYYDHKNGTRNGKGPGNDGKFGSIGLSTIQDEPTSGEANFTFCFVQPNTYTRVIVDSFQWSIFDIDRRSNVGDKNGIHEKIIIDTSQTSGYSFYPNQDETEIKQTCEDSNETPPCADGKRTVLTVFESTVDGDGDDNPTDPNALTEQQMKRSVVFTFEDTDCFDMVYSAYCPFEPDAACSWYGGSNFFFAGSAKQIIRDGACVTMPPKPTCSCDVDDNTSQTFKCGTDVYVCPGVERICDVQGSQQSTYYPLTQEQCNDMKQVEIGEKCVTLAHHTNKGSNRAKALSNRVCYDNTSNGYHGMKFDGSCDVCNDSKPPPFSAPVPTPAPAGTPVVNPTSPPVVNPTTPVPPSTPTKFDECNKKNSRKLSNSLRDKFALENPFSTTFDQETNKFSLSYDVYDSIVQDNTIATIYDKDCGIGNNEITVGIESVTTSVVSGKATLDFVLDTSELALNKDVFTAAGGVTADGSVVDDNTAEMKLCSRFMLQMGDMEVNFIESVITIFFDLTAGFELASFAVESKDKCTAVGEKGYNVTAYLCDPQTTAKQLPNNAFAQGSMISVCVTPDAASTADGIVMTSIDTFEWKRTQQDGSVIMQSAIKGGNPAPNMLTSLNCESGWSVCSFSSILFADFYVTPGEVGGSGMSNLEFGDNGGRLLVASLADNDDEHQQQQQQQQRTLQEEDTAANADVDPAATYEFDISVGISNPDDGRGALRTAGAVHTTTTTTALVSFLALFVGGIAFA